MNKIYIFTTGKQVGNLVLRDIQRKVSISHPLVNKPGNIDQTTVTKLFDLTQFDTAQNILNSPTFKEWLKLDYVRAFDEFGIELDDFASKTFETDTFIDGQVPVWDETEKKFEPQTITPGGGGSTQKVTQLICINKLTAMSPINVSISGINFNFLGEVPDLKTNSTIFNSTLSLQIELNSIKQDKGSQVMRFSSNQLQFYRDIEIGEQIFIYS